MMDDSEGGGFVLLVLVVCGLAWLFIHSGCHGSSTPSTSRASSGALAPQSSAPTLPGRWEAQYSDTRITYVFQWDGTYQYRWIAPGAFTGTQLIILIGGRYSAPSGQAGTILLTVDNIVRDDIGRMRVGAQIAQPFEQLRANSVTLFDSGHPISFRRLQ